MTQDSQKRSMRDAFGHALVRLGEANDRVVVLDADTAHSTRTWLFRERFSDRFFNVGIAEQNMVGIAAGLSTLGFVPFAVSFSFLLSQRALEQVRTSIAYPKLNVKLVGGYSGLSDSYDGTTHQSVCDVAIIRSIPNMTVLVAADAMEAEKAVFAAVDYDGPVFLRLSRAEVPVVFDKKHKFAIGKALTLKQFGTDVGIVATGVMVSRALEAASMLKREGIKATVLEVHTIKPLDVDAVVTLAEQTGALVTVEEHSIIGGLGGAVAEVLVERFCVPVVRIGIRDCFAESGLYDDLLDKYGLSADHVVQASRSVLERKLECKGKS